MDALAPWASNLVIYSGACAPITLFIGPIPSQDHVCTSQRTKQLQQATLSLAMICSVQEFECGTSFTPARINFLSGDWGFLARITWQSSNHVRSLFVNLHTERAVGILLPQGDPYTQPLHVGKCAAKPNRVQVNVGKLYHFPRISYVGEGYRLASLISVRRVGCPLRAGSGCNLWGRSSVQHAGLALRALPKQTTEHEKYRNEICEALVMSLQLQCRCQPCASRALAPDVPPEVNHFQINTSQSHHCPTIRHSYFIVGA